MKRIYEQFNCAYNRANLTAKIIAKSGESENAVELLQENILRATLERPNVSGAEQIEYDEDADTKVSAYTIFEEDGFYYLDIYIRNLTLGMHRVVFVIQYGTNAKIKLVYDINVTATSEGSQGITPNDIAISEQVAVETTTIDGVSGSIALGDGLQMVGKELSATGGSSVEIFDLGTLIGSVLEDKQIYDLVENTTRNNLDAKIKSYIGNGDIVKLVNLVLTCKMDDYTFILRFVGDYFILADTSIDSAEICFASFSPTLSICYSLSI